eukprot:scaffold126076_cov16-Tisochrysis_lutea.AAC.2
MSAAEVKPGNEVEVTEVRACAVCGLANLRLSYPPVTLSGRGRGSGESRDPGINLCLGSQA